MIASPSPLRSTRRHGRDEPVRGRPRAARAGPSRPKRSRSTPHGTTVIRRRSAPIRSSSKTSSRAGGDDAVDRARDARSCAIRLGGLVSRVALVAALDRPERVERVHDRDAEAAARRRARRGPTSRSARARRRAARRATASRRSSANAPMYGSSSSLGTPPAGRRRRGRPRRPGAAGPARAASDRRGGCGRRRRRRAGRAPWPARRRARSGRRRRRRRAPPAGWRARRPSRSSCGHLLHEQLVPVGEEAVEPVAGERRRAGRRAALAGLVRVGDEPRAGVARARRAGSTRRPPPAGRPRRPRSCRARRPASPRCIASSSERPERRPADRVQVDAAPGHLACSSACGRSRCAAERRPRPCRTGRAALPRRSAAAGRCRSPAPRRRGLVDDDGGARRARRV